MEGGGPGLANSPAQVQQMGQMPQQMPQGPQHGQQQHPQQRPQLNRWQNPEADKEDRRQIIQNSKCRIPGTHTYWGR